MYSIQTDDDDGSAPSVASAETSTVANSASAASAVDPFKSQLIDLLNVPAHLAGSGDVPLRVAYQKYKAFLVACSTLDSMVAGRTWTIKRPSRTDLIELFVSRSYFHSHYRPLFSQVVNDHPQMVAWLEGHPDSVDVDVWGVQKASYTFSHLSAWLDNGGAWASDNEDEHTVKKSKGKGRKRDLGKEKGKGKGKDLEGGRKHKKKERAK